MIMYYVDVDGHLVMFLKYEAVMRNDSYIQYSKYKLQIEMLFFLIYPFLF
jgi:hypothetical protein